MKLNKWSAVVSVMLLASSLAACSGGGKSPGSPQGSAADKGGDAAKKVSETPAELTFYVTVNGWTDQKFMESYGDMIKKKFPNYTLKFIPQEGPQTLPSMITAGQNIDIMISSIGLTSNFLLAYDMQYDITELTKKYNYDLSRLEPSTIEIQKQLAGGGMYGLPVNTTSAALFYNKSLFDKFGVPYPKEGMTWDETYELAKQLTRSDGGQSYKGLTMSVQHLMLLNQLSAPHIDDKSYKAMFTSDNFKQAFDNLARFYKISGNGLVGNKYSQASQLDPFYKEQNVAMYASLSTTANTLKDTMNWDMVQLPVFKDKPGVGPQSYPNYFYISKGSKNKDAAFQVLAYITSDEFQEFTVKSGNSSILKDGSKMAASFGAGQPYLKGKNIKSYLPAKFAAPTVKTQYQAIADKEMLAALVEVAGGKDVNTALREAAERADKAIAAEQKK
ncbi:hypothetical protein PAESOLCIP111_02072 [Paenibacillus solanacearum]|uniref:Extracellular solute-binding protein n=1 Tax=Paenibacillus solanacearum TaxID=2048548 RepID=A0A916NI26_9BACL|nr:extracellular solute-binding protein [Paenibacillus solanacearum]CAG7618001.1 hypothetical protein PAESOLCIP111_02072 [Paenibacillus solanacearum]